MASISKLFDMFDIEEEVDSQTVNGWAMAELGKLPDVGDRFTALGLDVEILNMDVKRVENLRVTVLGDEETEEKDSEE